MRGQNERVKFSFRRRGDETKSSNVARHVVLVAGSADEWRGFDDAEWKRRRVLLEEMAVRGGLSRITLVPNDRVDAEPVVALAHRSSMVVVDPETDGRRRLARAVAGADPADESDISRLLYDEAGDPDIVVIVGPTNVLPSALVWELAYAELVWVESDWTSLDVAVLDRALEVFAGRERRFGGVET